MFDCSHFGKRLDNQFSMFGIRSSKMCRAIMYAVAAMILISVIVMFVSPTVDLPRTALRAWQLAMLAQSALALAATLLAGYILTLSRYLKHREREPVQMASRELLNFVCCFLC
jgi:NADH:ubiquinone oxidoreductase subunit 6 (subunit J)